MRTICSTWSDLGEKFRGSYLILRAPIFPTDCFRGLKQTCSLQFRTVNSQYAHPIFYSVPSNFLYPMPKEAFIESESQIMLSLKGHMWVPVESTQGLTVCTWERCPNPSWTQTSLVLWPFLWEVCSSVWLCLLSVPLASNSLQRFSV